VVERQPSPSSPSYILGAEQRGREQRRIVGAHLLVRARRGQGVMNKMLFRRSIFPGILSGDRSADVAGDVLSLARKQDKYDQSMGRVNLSWSSLMDIAW